MGRIKSALEIALEKTESVKSDKTTITRYEARQKGKLLAGKYLEGEIASLADEIKKAPRDEQAGVKQGMFDIFVSQLALPDREEDLKRLENVVDGLAAIINNGRFNSVTKSISQAFRQYLNEAAQYEEAIKQQYAPKLRQKEEELSRRLGKQIQLDPFQDPEFVSFFNQNMNALKENYAALVEQVREEARGYLV